MSQDKQSAIEAAARAVASHLTPGWEKIHADKTHWHATHGMLEGIYSDENEPFQDDCREAARAAILAYLSALVEDEGAVEAVARILDPGVWAIYDLASSRTGLPLPTHDRSTNHAQSVLRTLATRAQGESS
jgi:hypothetical protein